MFHIGDYYLRQARWRGGWFKEDDMSVSGPLEPTR